MKMGPGIIFGVIVILIGLSILFKDFPFFRLIFGILLILWGVSVIFGGFNRRHSHFYFRMWNKDPHNVVFGESTYTASENAKEYNVVFGKNTIDLRNIILPETGKSIEINTAFGASDVFISKSTPVSIIANSAFGEVRMPNGNSSAFGTVHYTNEAFRTDTACLNLKIDVAFGSTKVIEF
jgi:predicted membrane protein